MIVSPLIRSVGLTAAGHLGHAAAAAPDRGELRAALEAWPDEAQLLLLVAAAEPVGDPGRLWRAARELRTVPEARQPAMKDELVAQHALSAPARALGGLLEQSAGRAHRRCGLAAAAAFPEPAVGRTADPASRVQRALAAAQTKHLAGAPHAAPRCCFGPPNDSSRSTWAFQSEDISSEDALRWLCSPSSTPLLSRKIPAGRRYPLVGFSSRARPACSRSSTTSVSSSSLRRPSAPATPSARQTPSRALGDRARRLDARDQLRSAHETFIGKGWRASPSGRPRPPGWPAQASPAEDRRATVHQRQTVEYHLRKVFSKLGITSRTQLDRALPQRDRRGAAGLNQAGFRRDR